MEFTNVFDTVGKKLVNHDAYAALKNQYKAKGYDDRKARFAALGCMSAHSQGGHLQMVLHKKWHCNFRENRIVFHDYTKSKRS